MRSLDLVKHAMEEALAVAAAMPEESAIMPSPSEGVRNDIRYREHVAVPRPLQHGGANIVSAEGPSCQP